MGRSSAIGGSLGPGCGGRIRSAGELLLGMRAELHPSSADHAIAELGDAARRRGRRGSSCLRSASARPRWGGGRRGSPPPDPGHRGVFLVGHAARTPLTMYWAAHLAVGPSSVISHRSAAALRRAASVAARRSSSSPCRGRAGGATPSVSTARRGCPRADVTEIDGLPVTSVARTLLDLGAVVPTRQVERAFDQAVVANAARLRRGPARPPGGLRPSGLGEAALGGRPRRRRDHAHRDGSRGAPARDRAARRASRADLPAPGARVPRRPLLAGRAAHRGGGRPGPRHARRPRPRRPPRRPAPERRVARAALPESARSSATRPTSRTRSGRPCAR